MHTTTGLPKEAAARQSVPLFSVTFVCIFLLVVIVVNALAVYVAWLDKSWGAMAILVVIGPVANGILVLFGLAMGSFLKLSQPQFYWKRHLLLTLGVPIAAIIIDTVLIFWVC